MKLLCLKKLPLMVIPLHTLTHSPLFTFDHRYFFQVSIEGTIEKFNIYLSYAYYYCLLKKAWLRRDSTEVKTLILQLMQFHSSYHQNWTPKYCQEWFPSTEWGGRPEHHWVGPKKAKQFLDALNYRVHLNIEIEYISIYVERIVHFSITTLL